MRSFPLGTPLADDQKDILIETRGSKTKRQKPQQLKLFTCNKGSSVIVYRKDEWVAKKFSNQLMGELSWHLEPLI